MRDYINKAIEFVNNMNIGQVAIMSITAHMIALTCHVIWGFPTWAVFVWGILLGRDWEIITRRL